MKKAALFVCLLAGMAFASTKSFSVTFAEPTMIGGTELKAGDYQCQLQNQTLVLKHGRDIAQATVKVETVDRKFTATSVSVDKANGASTVHEIEVGGTHTKLVLE